MFKYFIFVNGRQDVFVKCPKLVTRYTFLKSLEFSYVGTRIESTYINARKLKHPTRVQSDTCSLKLYVYRISRDYNYSYKITKKIILMVGL